ncbi:hypothetical protein NESM_000427400 [Novymonas esmeraldas]|uniref:F-box domain-containing protein n=1 Tax=Novymonas esmeraldas TaxID=1808958 RepID=A0AAW0EN06_9TRYP
MEVRANRPRANRAVAAVQSATGPALSPSPLVTVAATSRRRTTVTRYSSFEALCQATRQPDVHAALRQELESKLPRPSPRNDVAAMGDAAVGRVVQFLGPVSRSAATFALTCRAVRQTVARVMDLEVAVLTPAMVSAAALSRESVRGALATFAAARSAPVRSLVLHRDGLDAVRHETGDAAPAAKVVLPAPWVLQLVAQLPYLTVLDLRHVQLTEAQHSRVLHYLLSDLHLAAASTLCTIKMDAELMRYWAPGWWRRLVNLRALVIGSRYVPVEPVPGSSSAAAAAPPSLELPTDFYALMREEGRRWRLKLWVPLQPASLRQLLMPPSGTVLGGVAELLVNMRHNERTCDWSDGAGGGGVSASPAAAATTGAASSTAAAAEVPPESRSNATARKAGAAAVAAAAAVAEPVDVCAFPALTAATVVDVLERPEVAAEVYRALLDMAPALLHFNVCDTVAASVPSDAPKRRHGRP